MPEWLVNVIVGGIVLLPLAGFLWSTWRFFDYLEEAERKREQREFHRRKKERKP